MIHCQSKQTNKNKQKELWHCALQNANVPPIGDASALLDCSPAGQWQCHHEQCQLSQTTQRGYTALCLLVLMQY